MANVLVVGAGPCSLVAAKTCIEMGFKVSILNPQIQKWQNVESLELTKKMILKSRNRKHLFLAPNLLTRFNAKKVDVYENFIFGGLSELWGGVFLPPKNIINLNNSFKNDEVLEAVHFVEHFIDVENKSSTIYSAYRNRSKINGNLSSEPPIARSKKNNKNKWSATENYSDLEKNGTEFIDGYLDQILVTKDDLLQVSYVNDQRQLSLGTFKHIFLGTGVFGTARIILKNKPDVESIEIQDSGVTYGLGISKLKKGKIIQISEMKPEIVQVNSDEIGNIESFVQTYSISNELIESIKFKSIQRLVSLVNKLSLGCLRLVMIFHPSDKSKSILISRSGRGFLASPKNKENETKFQVSKYFRTMRQNHLFPLSPAFKFNPGSGVHSGAFTLNFNNGISEKIPKSFTNLPYVHILGSASMEKIPTGPIMFEAMVNSRIIVKRALN